MKNFPQELVDEVVDELLPLVEWNPTPHYNEDYCEGGISCYSTVSKAWAGRAQKHHFSNVCFDHPTILKKWRTRIAADPNGVSRHVRELLVSVTAMTPPELEGLKEHLNAFTGIKSLTIYGAHENMDILQHPFIKEWFDRPVGSSLIELQLNRLVARQRTIASLVASLPLLQILDVSDLKCAEDAGETDPPTPPRIPFFEGANHFIFRAGKSLDWVPSSARFGQLEIAYVPHLRELGPVNRWLASSSATLTDLTIGVGPVNCVSQLK